MNKKFKIGEVVQCTVGYNKGKKFIITEKMSNGMYGCKSVNKNDKKGYQYIDQWLKLAE